MATASETKSNSLKIRASISVLMQNLPQRILKKLPGIGQRLARAIDLSIADITSPQAVLPGHYYSPLPNLTEIKRDEEKIFCSSSKECPGISLNEANQLDLLYRLIPYYKIQPFGKQKTNNLRYFFENEMYVYSDAVFLFSMMMYIKPNQIIEVGSGYSSCLMLDTNERFFDNAIKCTFIEPYPERLLSLIREGDAEQSQILKKRVQDIPIELFLQLSENDILFIDSSHVSKIGSDINYIVFEILPRLPKGVYVHFHDIYYPFEYPKSLIQSGFAFNEAYMIRAFLAFNSCYEIVLFNTFLEQFYEDFFKENMPLCLKNKGASLWLKKI